MEVDSDIGTHLDEVEKVLRRYPVDDNFKQGMSMLVDRLRRVFVEILAQEDKLTIVQAALFGDADVEEIAEKAMLNVKILGSFGDKKFTDVVYKNFKIFNELTKKRIVWQGHFYRDLYNDTVSHLIVDQIRNGDASVGGAVFNLRQSIYQDLENLS